MAKAHAKAFRDIPNVLLAGVFNRTKSRAEAFAKEFQILNVYNSTEELWRSTQADLVEISVS